MLQIQSPTSLMFEVHRQEPELVAPSKPTPHEFKPLSDIDNLPSVRIHVPILQFFPRNPSMNGVDPVKVIRKVVSDTLVFYYPFAGRLREDRLGKLIVECTGEGVLFIEADTNVTLDQFGYPLVPPIPCLDQLLFNVPGSDEFLHCPLLLIQVTRLKCGGFIFGLRCNHTMSDGAGLVQFVTAVSEMARGATSPSVLPTWERNLLKFNTPSQVQHKYNNVQVDTRTLMELIFPKHACYRAFFFTPKEVATLLRHVPLNLQNFSSFDLITASVWKCRVVALQPDPTEEMSLILATNLRSKFNHLIPSGYYGNAIALSVSKSTAEEIIENPLSYVLQLVKNAKDKVTEDYIRTPKDVEPKDFEPSMRSYSVTDMRHGGFEKVDFGWGRAIFSGLPICGTTFGYHYPYGESGIMLPLCLQKPVMERFEKELNRMLNEGPFCRDENVSVSKL